MEVFSTSERLFMLAVRKDILDFNPFNSMSVSQTSVSLGEILSRNGPKFISDKESKYHDEM